MIFAQARPLAPFATQAANSRGRLVSERASPTRSDFQRDRDRVLHSAAFRRLKHKTQVFVEHEGDHFRTRLTHSLEVAQIARSISRALGLDEDLAETLALAHDLGHTPFGHTGEDALEAQMQKWGGFDHNAQALRIVTRLERRYAAFDGLNLTWETLEGLVKHNGPLRDGAGAPLPRHQAHGIAGAILEFDAVFPLDLASHAGPEAQAAAISDDIAYNAHDIDDGLRAGLFTRADLDGVPFLAALNAEIVEEWPMLDEARAIHELMRRVITRFVEDVISESERRLVALAPENVAAVRAAPSPVIGFSAGMAAADRDIKNFLMPRMYRHPKVMVVREQAAEVVADLFTRFMADPDALPPDWRDGLQTGDGRGEEGRRARRVADYIAGMTDRFALQEHRRLFDHTPPLR